jgi:signal transduction histidine kinase
MENYLMDHKGDAAWASGHSAKNFEEIRTKVTDYAFYTAHNLRHPITNLLSLIELVKDLGHNEESREELFNLIKVETLKLDEVIRVMITKLEPNEQD